MDSQQPPKEPAAGEMQQGVVYPPPPSYYENMQLPAELPPLPEKQAAVQAGKVESSYRPLPMGRQPLYMPGQHQYPGTMPPASAARRQTWVIVAIISASVLLLCGAGSWALVNIFGAVSQQQIGANQVAQDFYQQMLQQDYNGAYADLQISGLTASAFTQDAQSMNAQYGQISSFSIDTTSFNSANAAPNATHWQFTVHVTRQQTTYSVQVPVDSINGSWKITSIDLNKF
ncbi:MAG: hypothetical protein ACRDIV_14460 [Ktedonobacteraceae bacterium]